MLKLIDSFVAAIKGVVRKTNEILCMAPSNVAANSGLIRSPHAFFGQFSIKITVLNEYFELCFIYVLFYGNKLFSKSDEPNNELQLRYKILEGKKEQKGFSDRNSIPPVIKKNSCRRGRSIKLRDSLRVAVIFGFAGL